MKYRFIIMLLLAVQLMACKKFIDEKPNAKLSVPNSTAALQALLDDFQRINTNFPGVAESGSDEYYYNYNDWLGRSELIRNAYTWEKENLIQSGNNNDWVNAYRKIYIANVVLSEIRKIERSAVHSKEWDMAQGGAYFLRGISYAQLAWTFCMAYDQATAQQDAGLVLRTDPDFNVSSTRSSLAATYELMIDDLKKSYPLLPDKPLHVMRPSKAAAYGWLTRAYLSMRSYDSAYVYADKYLQIYHELIDYNTIPVTARPIIPSFNIEVAYHSTPTQVIFPQFSWVDSVLYASYAADDLRKHLLFTPPTSGHAVRFRGSYDGNTDPGAAFNGIATDEMYLSRAECLARKNQGAAALNDLQTLLKKRWDNRVPFPAFTMTDPNMILATILLERRKELYMRGLRWMDLKRLNKEGLDIVLKRKLQTQEYSLLPNSLRYALPIPDDVIRITGITQNER